MKVRKGFTLCPRVASLRKGGFTLYPRASSLRKGGFTLIELLVVVAIIGILATIVIASLGSARAKARDAKRLSEMKNLQTALENYYLDFGFYPQMTAHTESGSTSGVAAFELALKPYIDINIMSSYYYDASGANKAVFYYRSKSSQNYQNYGAMIHLENSSLNWSDGGSYSSLYEFGPNPQYCMQKYPSGGGNWWAGAQRCSGGD